MAAAARGLERIVGLDPGNSRAWFALGQTLFRMGLWQRAEHAYGECIAVETDPVVLARAWQGSGMHEPPSRSPVQLFQHLTQQATPDLAIA